MKDFSFSDKDLGIFAVVIMSMTCFIILAFVPAAPILEIFKNAILVIGSLVTGAVLENRKQKKIEDKEV